MIRALITRQEEQQLVVTFINDTDFVSEGEDSAEKM